MKRISNVQIDQIVCDYIARRNYSLNDNSSSNAKLEKMKSNTCSLSDMALNGSLAETNACGLAVSLSASVADFSVRAESAYKQFVGFVRNQKCEQIAVQLSQLQFPFFVYIFIELYQCGHRVSARRLFRDHKQKFIETVEYKSVIESISNTLNVHSIDANLSCFRNSKYNIKMSHECWQQLINYFKQANDLVLIQTLNLCFDLQLHSSDSKSQNENNEKPTNHLYIPSHTESSSNPSNSQSLTVDKESLLSAIKKVHRIPPHLPSICLYSINSSNLCSVSVTEDINFIAGGFENSCIYLWNLETSQSLNQCSQSEISVKRQSSLIELAFVDHAVDDHSSQAPKSGDSNNNDETLKVLRGHSESVYGLAFIPKSNILLSCSGDTTVRAWDSISANNVSIYEGHRYPIWSIDCSILGDYFATGSKDGIAHLWCSERTFPLRLFSGHNMDVDCVKFHPNCNLIATGSGDKTIKLWDIHQTKVMRVFQGHNGSVYCLSFSPCGKYLASSGEDRKIKIWDIANCKMLKEISGHSETVYSIAFNYDGSMLASCGADKALKLWNLQNVISGNSVNTSDNGVSEDKSSIASQPKVLLNSFPLELNILHTQFMPHNLLLTIGTKII